MTEDRAPRDATVKPCIQIRVAWGAATIDVAHLDPPRDFTLGELARVCEPGAVPLTGDVAGRLVELDAGGWPCLVSREDSPAELVGASWSERDAAGDVVDMPAGGRGLRLREGDSASLSIHGIDVVVLAIDPAPAPLLRRASFDRRTKLVAAGVIVGHLALALALASEDDPVVGSEPTTAQIAEMQRLLRVAAENDEPEQVALDHEGKEGGAGTRAKGEEGSLGDASGPGSRSRFGVQGPPHRAQAQRDAAEFGMIGLLNSGAGGDPSAPTAPWGRDAGGGSGVGLGSIGTIGHGAGTGTGQGFGSGRPGGAHHAPPSSSSATRPQHRSSAPPAPLDPDGRFATTYRPGRGHLASFEAALARGVLPPEAREVVADVAAGGDGQLAAPTKRALAWSADFERTRPAPQGGKNHLRIALRSAVESAGRPRLSVHLVLDTSGSMQGEAMAQAKLAAKELVAKLAPTDDFSLVAFSSGAEVAVEEGPVGARRVAIQRVIDGLRAEGGTNISEGMRLAYAEARSSAVPADAVRVVFLMSDGRPNGGMMNPEKLSRLALDAFQDGIQTSAFGLGADYDGALMSQIASDGAGGYYYVASPEHIAAALSTELEKRLDPVALGVEVRVRLKPDVKLLSVYGSRRLGAQESAKVRAQETSVDVTAAKKSGIARDREDDSEGGMRFFMPAFGRDDAHAILLQLDLPPGVGERGVATVEVKYKDLIRRNNVVDEKPLRLAWADGDAESAASADRPMQRAIQRFGAGQALATAAVKVQAGDSAGALALLDERVGILRHAAIVLGEPSLGSDADRLGRLRAFIDPSGQGGDALALAMLVDAAGQSRLR